MRNSNIAISTLPYLNLGIYSLLQPVMLYPFIYFIACNVFSVINIHLLVLSFYAFVKMKVSCNASFKLGGV